MGEDSEKAFEGGHSGEPCGEDCRGKLVGEDYGGILRKSLGEECEGAVHFLIVLRTRSHLECIEK